MNRFHVAPHPCPSPLPLPIPAAPGRYCSRRLAGRAAQHNRFNAHVTSPRLLLQPPPPPPHLSRPAAATNRRWRASVPHSTRSHPRCNASSPGMIRTAFPFSSSRFSVACRECDGCGRRLMPRWLPLLLRRGSATSCGGSTPSCGHGTAGDACAAQLQLPPPNSSPRAPYMFAAAWRRSANAGRWRGPKPRQRRANTLPSPTDVQSWSSSDQFCRKHSPTSAPWHLPPPLLQHQPPRRCTRKSRSSECRCARQRGTVVSMCVIRVRWRAPPACKTSPT